MFYVNKTIREVATCKTLDFYTDLLCLGWFTPVDVCGKLLCGCCNSHTNTNTRPLTKNNESQPVALYCSIYIKCIVAPHECRTQYLWKLSKTRMVWYTLLPLAMQLAAWEQHVTSWRRVTVAQSALSPKWTLDLCYLALCL